MIRLQRHIGGGALMGPASDWPVVREVELVVLLLVVAAEVLVDDVVGGVPVALVDAISVKCIASKLN